MRHTQEQEQQEQEEQLQFDDRGQHRNLSESAQPPKERIKCINEHMVAVVRW